MRDAPQSPPAKRYCFEWHANKESLNVQKHDGITFRLTSSVFHDPLAVTIYDDEHSDNEDRWVTIGQGVSGQTLVVVHTFEPLDAQRIEVRIISARKADRQERKDYEKAPR